MTQRVFVSITAGVVLLFAVAASAQFRPLPPRPPRPIDPRPIDPRPNPRPIDPRPNPRPIDPRPIDRGPITNPIPDTPSKSQGDATVSKDVVRQAKDLLSGFVRRELARATEVVKGRR